MITVKLKANAVLEDGTEQEIDVVLDVVEQSVSEDGIISISGAEDSWHATFKPCPMSCDVVTEEAQQTTKMVDEGIPPFNPRGAAEHDRLVGFMRPQAHDPVPETQCECGTSFVPMLPLNCAACAYREMHAFLLAPAPDLASGGGEPVLGRETFEEAVRATFRHWHEADPRVQGLREGHVGEITALHRQHCPKTAAPEGAQRTAKEIPQCKICECRAAEVCEDCYSEDIEAAVIATEAQAAKNNGEPVRRQDENADLERAWRWMLTVSQGCTQQDVVDLMNEVRREAVLEERRRAQQMGQAVPCPETAKAILAPRCRLCGNVEHECVCSTAGRSFDPPPDRAEPEGGRKLSESQSKSSNESTSEPDLDTVFSCPRCGGDRFGTSGAATPDVLKWTGYCNQIGCGFSWSRAEDWRYFRLVLPNAESVEEFERQKTKAEYLSRIISEAKNKPTSILDVIKNYLISSGWKINDLVSENKSGELQEFVHPETGRQRAWLDAIEDEMIREIERCKK